MKIVNGKIEFNTCSHGMMPDSCLECKLEQAKKEIEHWKANHRTEVERARVLKERTDMPLERVQAYELIGNLQKELDHKQSIIDSLMLEYCPEEMTKEQLDNWEIVQKPI